MWHTLTKATPTKFWCFTLAMLTRRNSFCFNLNLPTGYSNPTLPSQLYWSTDSTSSHPQTYWIYPMEPGQLVNYPNNREDCRMRIVRIVRIADRWLWAMRGSWTEGCRLRTVRTKSVRVVRIVRTLRFVGGLQKRIVEMKNLRIARHVDTKLKLRAERSIYYICDRRIQLLLPLLYARTPYPPSSNLFHSFLTTSS